MAAEELVDEVRALVDDVRDATPRATVTLVVTGALIGGFLFQLYLLVRTDAASVQQITEVLFRDAPTEAWLLSPLLHRDVAHLAANLAGLLVAGPFVERHLERRQYVAVILVAAAVASALGGAVLSVFGDSMHVAGYGASGIVFAFASFGSVHFLRAHERRSAGERLVVLLGITALLTILWNVVSGPYFDPYWFNGGHLGGALVGLVAAVLHEATTSECDAE